MTAVADEKPCALYRYFDARGRLLYVGISYHVIIRASQHRNAPWYTEYATSRVERFSTRAEAAAAEIKAIRRERPLYNKAHNEGRRRSAGPTAPAIRVPGTPAVAPKGHPWGYYHAESVYRLMRVAPEILETISGVIAAHRQYVITEGGGACSSGFWSASAPDGRTWEATVQQLAGWRRPTGLDDHRHQVDRAWLAGAAHNTVSRLVYETVPSYCSCASCDAAYKEYKRIERLTMRGLCPTCEQWDAVCRCESA